MRTQEVVSSYMADCRLRGLSPRTLKNCNYCNQRLIQLSPSFPPKPLIIQEFLASVNPQNADTFWRYWHALGSFTQRRYRRFRKHNFMNSVARPRVPKKIMPTISEAQIRLLAEALKRGKLRDKAIFALFLDCAVRVGEAANLKFDDIQEDIIIVHGKTGYGKVPMSPNTRGLLLALPRKEDGYVFHGKFGKPLGVEGFRYVVKKYLRGIGYTGEQPSPQNLRRSFGRLWFKDGGDPKSLQLIYRHASIITTLVHYAAFQEEDVKEIHHKHTPGRIFEGVK